MHISDRGPRHTLAATRPPNGTIALKRDVFGTIGFDPEAEYVVRDYSAVSPWVRWLARVLAHREAHALRQLHAHEACPGLVSVTRERLVRTHLPGAALHESTFEPETWFRDALRQLRRMHASGVVHNDLAKEANWICMPGNRAGIVDFQIAWYSRRRGKLFRLLAREDLRHLLKHKKHYAAQRLTDRQRRLLAKPAWTARGWRRIAKPVYRLITRRLLGWPERNSAVERSI